MAEETPQMKGARESAEKRGEKLEVVEGKVLITCGASELIPTVQYGNATIGPVTVSRLVDEGDDEHLAEKIRQTQALCEAAVAEERQTVHTLLRANTSRS